MNTNNTHKSNKLFISDSTSKNQSMVSKFRVNREYLISNEIANELNTYTSFEPFTTFNDLHGDGSKTGTPGVRSLFNKSGAVVLGDKQTTDQIISEQASSWRISNNVPLMDNRKTRQLIKDNSGCTVKELVKQSQDGLLGRETYSYSDFMFCKYLGRISNNYMITLRRFPYPVDDFISSIGVENERKNKNYTTMNTDSMGCLVTWMGTPGNEMSNILKYSVSMPFQEVKAEMQSNQIDADSQKSPLNAIAAVFDPKYREQYMNGGASTAVNEYAQKFFPVGDAPYPASQYENFSNDNSKVYGPVDTIKTTFKRSEEGLGFDQNITITFDYELRSYNGINPRQAMLDLLANILNVTYSTGTFWGGGFKGGGAHQNNIFTNLNIFKKNGGFTDFVDSFSADVTTIKNEIGNTIESNGGVLETIKQFANQLGGMIIGGLLNNMGRPSKQAASSFLSPAPIGFWHLTIGNPHHPIMSIGNMILKNTTIEHYGPLGLDDFPTGLKVTCELTRGKSRDIRDIEKLYMHGNDRIYSSMGPKIFDMYKHSKEYRSKYKHKNGVVGDADTNISITGGDSIKIDDIGGMKHVLQKYFGHVDTTSIAIAAMEQEMGAQKKKKKGTAGGDSSVQGNK